MHKAPILESKQIEHVLNERRILEEASGHPFCVGLVRAYQDKPCLYLLQEWVGGTPIAHALLVCVASACTVSALSVHAVLVCGQSQHAVTQSVVAWYTIEIYTMRQGKLQPRACSPAAT